MAKITIDARMINHSGIGTYLKNLLPGIVKKHNVVLLGNPEITSQFDWSQTVQIINCKSKIYSFQEQWELPLKIPRCDFFISPHYNVPVFTLKVRRKLAVIHDVYHLAFRNKLSMLQRFYSRFLINFAVKNFDEIITVSRFSESEIIKYTQIDKKKIRTVYPGYDAEFISLDKVEHTLTRKKYNLPDRYILFVGNVKPHKNLKNLLLAYKILINKNPNIKLVVAGKKEGFILSDRELFLLLEQNQILEKEVVFTGYIEPKHIGNIYSMAEVFVFPSVYEGFGSPPIEAMTAGTPVIVSREGSLPEVCADAALYCDAFSPHNIAEKIETVLNDENLRHNLILKGKNNILRFTKEKFQQAWINIIDENE